MRSAPAGGALYATPFHFPYHGGDPHGALHNDVDLPGPHGHDAGLHDLGTCVLLDPLKALSPDISPYLFQRG